ncbi:MAG: ATP-binding protein [Gammaproteobacteria bacterium]
MTFDYNQLLLAALIYLLLLFLIAYAADRNYISEKITHHPLTYVLSLGVYTTSWSFYGSVGFAEQQGLLFLTIYLGPTLAFLLTPLLLAPILRLIKDYQLTSLADLFAFRYSSQLAGILVTLLMLAGTLPYIALQISAVAESLSILTAKPAPLRQGFMFCLILMVFALLFGARHITPKEKHSGLVVAIAFESLVKLTALFAVGLFAVFGVFGDLQSMQDWLQADPARLEAFYQPAREGPWLTLIFLSFSAAFLLPRQFHMLFVENLHRRSLAVASWGFPLYLLLFNLAIPPILWAGQYLQTDINSEFYVLAVSLHAGQPWLALLAFIGGVSAASAMVIITTLALSQMALNHLLLPISYPDPTLDMYRWLLWGRRMLVSFIILIGFGLFVLLKQRPGLVELGLISFVAVAQCIPGLIGVLFWQRATRTGFLVGLGAGILGWLMIFILPLLHQIGVFPIKLDVLAYLLGPDTNVWQGATLLTLGCNSFLFALVSLLSKQYDDERRAVAACFENAPLLSENRLLNVTSPRQFSAQLAKILGEETGRQEVAHALSELQLDDHERRPHQLQRLRDRIERNLSGMLGPTLARMIVDSRLQVNASTRSMLSDHIRFIEDRLEQSRSRLRGLVGELDALRRYHRQILQDLPLAACSLSKDDEILSWNQAMEQLSRIDRQAAIGSQLCDLPEPWSTLLRTFLREPKQHQHKVQTQIHGKPRWFNLHKAAIADKPTNDHNRREPFWASVVILLEDLTELQLLETELAHSERLASIGRLAAGVAHEIGNPVTGIASITQNLKYETEPQIITESLDDILEQTRRINDIVQSLLTFSHGGALPAHGFTSFALNRCVDEAIRLVRLSQTGKRLEFNNHCPPHLQISADRQHLLQVFVNLLTNACDASSPGGTIEVSAELENADVAQTDHVLIQVRDQGSGIPVELMDRIFEPFFTTKDPGKGTGLGLPLVYNIIRDHGGMIWVDAMYKQGTRFYIKLPVRQPSESTALMTLPAGQ